MSMLEIKDLNCFYGNVQVLWDVNMHIEEGELVALLGANGAGKTTLLNAITGTVKPRRGPPPGKGSGRCGASPCR